MRRLTTALTLAALLGAAAPAWACPNCKEAAASAIDSEDDPLQEARAYNRSIFFMLSVPYAIVAFGGFYLYRHCRARPNDLAAGQG